MDQQTTAKQRFHQHTHRHPQLSWEAFQEKMAAHHWQQLATMEETGGEPDVVMLGERLLVVDCAAESPQRRRSACYDKEARVARVKHAPLTSAMETAEALELTLVDEALYLQLQALEPFDTKTSSWLLTPPAIRAQGGAIFGDRRFGRTFIYHNGADSYYSSRGFRLYFELR